MDENCLHRNGKHGIFFLIQIVLFRPPCLEVFWISKPPKIYQTPKGQLKFEQKWHHQIPIYYNNTPHSHPTFCHPSLHCCIYNYICITAFTMVFMTSKMMKINMMTRGLVVLPPPPTLNCYNEKNLESSKLLTMVMGAMVVDTITPIVVVTFFVDGSV